MVVSLGDVLFDTGDSHLKPGAQRTLDQLAKLLQDNPERRLSVEGFTDSVGNESYNERFRRPAPIQYVRRCFSAALHPIVSSRAASARRFRSRPTRTPRAGS